MQRHSYRASYDVRSITGGLTSQANIIFLAGDAAQLNSWHVNQCFTSKSRRRVAIATPVVDLLRAIKGQQIEHAELTLGVPWDADGFVSAKLDGSPHDPEVATKDFAKRMRVGGLQGLRLHDLRHTHASLMLAAGENVKVVQERLGPC